jgi:perosamine synthetase
VRQIGLGTFQTTDRMRTLINRVLDSSRLSYGPMSQAFESRFAAMHGCKYGVLSNSGTSSLLVALQTLRELHGWEDGDEVLCPALTFVSGINIVIQNRLKPVLVDIDDYWNIDCNLIEQTITPRTRAIMPVHLFGQPCDIRSVKEIADKYKIAIIEDSCEAAFASQAGKSISSWGDMGCHSFYMAHLITTGVGGITLTNSRDYAMKLRSLCNHGLSYWHLSNNEEFDPMMLSRHFVFDSIGHSARITELESALGLAQLDDWQDIKAKRQANHQYFIDMLTGLHDEGFIRLPCSRADVSYTPMMFPIATLTESKHSLMSHLTERGIGVRDTLPLTCQPAYKGLFNEDDYPKAKFMNERGLYWPVHQGLTKSDLDYIIQMVLNYYEH